MKEIYLPEKGEVGMLLYKEFEGLTEFVDAAHNYNPKDLWTSNYEGTGSRSDFCPYSWAQTVEQSRKGWREGRMKVKTALAQIPHEFMEAEPNLKLDVAGAYPNVPVSVSGDPFSMIDIGEDFKQRHPVVTIVYNLMAPCGQSPQTFVNVGAALMAVIDHLETMGSSVEFYVSMHSSNSYNRNGALHPTSKVFGVAIKVKLANQALDIDRMTFACAHVGFYRKIWFQHKVIDPRISWLTSNLGSPMRLSWRGKANRFVQTMAQSLELPGRKLVRIESTRQIPCDTVEAALEHITKQIDEQLNEDRLDILGAA